MLIFGCRPGLGAFAFRALEVLVAAVAMDMRERRCAFGCGCGCGGGEGERLAGDAGERAECVRLCEVQVVLGKEIGNGS